MAGSAPPPDGPPPSDTASSDQGFPPGPAAAQLCGFTLPTQFALPPISLPSLASLITIPKLSLLPSLGINCSSSNPMDVTNGVPAGGGRVPTGPPDPEDVNGPSS